MNEISPKNFCLVDGFEEIGDRRRERPEIGSIKTRSFPRFFDIR